jgi:hypothetical protein
MNDRQHNGQNKKDKRTNNNIPNTTQQPKEGATQTSLKHRVNSCDPER